MEVFEERKDAAGFPDDSLVFTEPFDALSAADFDEQWKHICVEIKKKRRQEGGEAGGHPVPKNEVGGEGLSIEALMCFAIVTLIAFAGALVSAPVES